MPNLATVRLLESGEGHHPVERNAEDAGERGPTRRAGRPIQAYSQCG